MNLFSHFILGAIFGAIFIFAAECLGLGMEYALLLGGFSLFMSILYYKVCVMALSRI